MTALRWATVLPAALVATACGSQAQDQAAVTPTPASTAPSRTGALAARTTRWQWGLSKLMRMIDGTRIRVGSRTVRVASESTLCSGVGRPHRRNGVARWGDFACTYTVFLPSGDRDLEFRVLVRGRRAYVITNGRWIGASR